MNIVLTPEETEFSRKLDVRQLLQSMGFAANAIIEEEGMIRVYCPIHKDQILRSLVINRGENRFHCQFKQCPAHHGGEIVQLLAMYLGVTVPEAIEHFQRDEKPEQQLVTQADKLIETGKMEEAKAVLKEAVRLAPRDEVTRCKLAAAYLETDERDSGFREYLVAAEDFAVKNQIEKTLSIYNILIMLSPSDLRVRRHLAFLFSRLGRHKDAAEHLKWVVDQLLTRGENAEAMKVVRQILEMGVEEPDVLMLHAGLLSQAHRINEAVTEAQRAAELALARRDMKTAEQAVTFGLIYHPQDETFRELEARLRDRPLVDPLVSELVKQDDEFGAWIESLEDEVVSDTPLPKAEPVAAAAPPEPEKEAPSIVRRKRWKGYCQDTLKDLDGEKLDSMGHHLRSMFDDVQSQFQEGMLDDWEMSVVRDFYTTFCSAYEEVRKSKPAEDSLP